MNGRAGRVYMAVAVAALVIVVHAVIDVTGGSPAWRGGFFDGDSYMRVMRVNRLIETGGWFDSSFPRANAPFGFDSHWTRPFDVLLIGLAAPLAPFIGFAEAVHVAGVVVSPLLHIALALVLMWAAAPLIGRIGGAIAAIVTVTQLGLMKLTAFGVADHHAAFILITAVVLGFTVRALASTGALAAGLFAAAGLWVGPEFLLFLALVLAVLGLAWVAGGGAGSGPNLRFATGLAAGTALALAMERGIGGFAAVEYDRISVVHLTLAALVLAAWSAIALVERMGRGPGGPAGRLAVGTVAAVAVGTVLLILFPRFLHGPEADIGATLFPVLDTIHEYRPLGDATNLLGYVGGALFALPVLARRLWCERHGPRLWAWVLVAAATLVYVGLTVDWIRWAPYAGLFLALGLANLLVTADRAMTARMALAARIPAKIAVFVLVVLGPIALGGAIAPGKEKAVACPLEAMTGFLAEGPWGTEGRTVLTAANFGPRILYETPHRVIATVHHRNEDGLLDSIRILRAATDEEALKEIRRRGIDVIILCPGYPGNHYARPDDGVGVFHGRLLGGHAIDWIREEPLPADLAARFRLFTFTRP